MVSTRLSKISCDTYAIESMTYYTAGLLDEFDQQDTDLESGILKVKKVTHCKHDIYSFQQNIDILFGKASKSSNFRNELYGGRRFSVWE